jgi:hypothetical protein
MVMASVAAVIALRLLVTMPPDNHPVTTIELLLAAFSILAGLPGVGMLIEGPAIFGLVDRPRER